MFNFNNSFNQVMNNFNRNSYSGSNQNRFNSNNINNKINNLNQTQQINTKPQKQMFKSIDGKQWESYEQVVIQNNKLYNKFDPTKKQN